MEDILKFLEEKKGLIDSVLKEIIPKKMSNEYIEFALGKARYSYDVDTLEKSLSEPIWDFLERGGKRWRPALFLLLTEALSGDIDRVKDFVAIPELVHNGTLMVDDVEDLGELRRGKPCTHKIYGVDVAVNTGNFLYFIPLNVIKKNSDNFSAETIKKVYDVYAQEMINLSIGQAMDIWWHKGKAENVTEDQYLQMCAYKTGTLARMSAKLAAVLSDASNEEIEKIGRFAETIGVAFQIQDDLLSANCEGFQCNKGFGDDVTEGKRTLMVIHTLNNASEEDKSRLLEILGIHTHENDLCIEVLDILKKYDAVNYAKEYARKLMTEAWQEVEPVLKESEAKNTLKSFADFLINREI
jgi:geranylgeranyl pyrophosphate synthase